MGRQQYLTRLALGRSAFADPEDEDDDELANGDDQQVSPAPADASPNAAASPSSPERSYVQQYDAKGRPVNPAAEERKAALRNAENAALALVGVVKRNDTHDRVRELRFRTISTIRANVLADENENGDGCDLVTTFISALNYATETLIRRVQAGMYSPASSFTSVLAAGLEAIRIAGLKGAFAVLFPGSPAAMLHATIRVLTAATISHAFEKLSLWLIRQKLRKRTTRRVHRALYFACEAVLIGVDVALLPLEYYAYAQRLGLAPTWPLLPDWRIMLPSHPGCIHNFGWTSKIGIPAPRRLCSPAALIILQNAIWREQDSEVPVFGQVTTFQYPEPFNDPLSPAFRPAASSDPMGWILYQGYLLRTKLLRFLGYRLEHRARLAQFENDCLPAGPRRHTPDRPIRDGMSSSDDDDDGQSAMHHVHRSTVLAHLAPKYLAGRIDVAYAKLLLLPLQTLTVRAIAQSYMASPLPKTLPALAVLPHLYAPFGGELLRTGNWSGLAAYLSKLGLSLGLHAATSASIFFMLYGLARWQGRRNFDWGMAGVVGGFTYPTEDEE